MPEMGDIKMIQPKFKFGEKVFWSNRGHSLTFIVSEIKFIKTNSDGSGEYKYNGAFWESECQVFHSQAKDKAMVRE